MQACNDQLTKRKEAKKERDERKKSDESHSISGSSGGEEELNYSNLKRSKTNQHYTIQCERLD
jgi:hypothetical protein